MKEQECKHCRGLGKIPRTDGQTMVCRACNGRGAILFTPNERFGQSVVGMLKGVAPPGSSVPYGGDIPDYQPIQMPVIDPQAAQRREYALKTAMAAFQMCNGFSGGMFGTSSRGDGEMQPEEIVPLARDIERFLGGD